MQLVSRAAPIIEALKGAEVVVVDTETSSLRPHRDGRILAGVGVKPVGGECFYMPIRHSNGSFKQATMRQLGLLGDALKGKTLVYHNAKFDMAVLKNDGVDLVGEETLDTVVLVRLVSEEEPSYELKRLAKRYATHICPEDPESVGAQQKELRKLMRKNGWETYDQVPAEQICDYVTDDLEYTEFFLLRSLATIARRDEANLKARNGKPTALLTDVLGLEKRLTPWLFRMEERGVRLNRSHVKRELAKAKRLTGELERACYEAAGQEFNLRSPPQIRKLFEGMGVKSAVKTKKGKDSYNSDAMALIDDPLAAAITSFRGADNIKNYYAKFDELMDADGVLHCSFHQAGARTGRFSCREPNLQNIPKEGLKIEDLLADPSGSLVNNVGFEGNRGDGKTSLLTMEELKGYGAVRAAFVPRPGHFLLLADWRQVELMVLADYADDPTMIEAFRLGLDIHALTATAAYGPWPPDATEAFAKWWRSMGKGINFGLVYGMGVALLAKKIGKSKAEAEVFMAAYFARFPGVRLWLDRMTNIGKGWAKNKWGRRRYLPQEAMYKMPNFLVQGTSADLMKQRLTAVCEALAAAVLAAMPLLTIHDELMNEIPYEEAYDAIPIIAKEMETCGNLKVPLKVDLKWSAKSWADKEPLDCDGCGGSGVALDVPKADLVTALAAGDTATLRAANDKPCGECGGRGWDLNKLRVPRTTKRRAA